MGSKTQLVLRRQRVTWCASLIPGGSQCPGSPAGQGQGSCEVVGSLKADDEHSQDGADHPECPALGLGISLHLHLLREQRVRMMTRLQHRMMRKTRKKLNTRKMWMMRRTGMLPFS